MVKKYNSTTQPSIRRRVVEVEYLFTMQPAFLFEMSHTIVFEKHRSFITRSGGEVKDGEDEELIPRTAQHTHSNRNEERERGGNEDSY